MDTLENMRKALDYIEENLDGKIDYAKIAKIALCSKYHFQRMFVFLLGIPLSEYIRRRRLTLAAFDLQNTKDKVIDIAARYDYSSPDAFTRAFQAMHQLTPTQARTKGVTLKAQPRVAFTVSLKGISEMKYRIVEKDEFTIIGIRDRFSYVDNLGKSVGQMWANTSKETMEQIASLADGKPIEFVGAYSDMYDDHTTDYYIGVISSKDCPNGLEVLKITAQTWAVFEIIGALPTAMAEIWGRIFSEFFPSTGYEHTPAPEIEWYSNGDMSSTTYKSEIWIPIAKKKN